MTTGSALVSGPPSGYAEQRERGADVVALPSVLPTVCAALRQHGTLHAWAASRPGARAFTGRGAAHAVDTPDGAWVVRHYRRGGAVARVLYDRYFRLGEARPLVELRASHAARARGVATPEVVAAVIYPAGPLYRADLATRLVPDAADLADTVLGSVAGSAPAHAGGAADRVAAWRAAGALLRHAFAAGVVHADLNLRNILVQRRPAGPTAWLLDLDRAVLVDGGVDDVARRRMLARLHRSRVKLEAVYGTQVSAAELQAFAEAVHG